MTASRAERRAGSEPQAPHLPVPEDLFRRLAEPDRDTAPLELGLEDGRGVRIELSRQEAVEELDDVDLGLAAADGPGDLQPEQTAPEDGHPPVLSEMGQELVGVVERPQHEDALLVDAGDGGRAARAPVASRRAS